MNSLLDEQAPFKCLSPDNLYQQIHRFTKGMAVTKGSFEIHVERCTFEDMEWNHMDQMHRPVIHHTYDKGVRIAYGKNFALSLTQWGKWPFFITVSDTFVDRGLFYQSLTIGGVIFLHSIISMEKEGDGINLKNEWYIASHKIFKIAHRVLDRKLYKLNTRLQQEDAQIRHGRFDLRQTGYRFKTDNPNFHNSNILRMNTIYPELNSDSFFSLDDCHGEQTIKKIGNIEFIVKKENGSFLVWPAACPHEGGPLTKGVACGEQISCPWHGLRFSPVRLNAQMTQGSKYGFEYLLRDNKIYVKKMAIVLNEKQEEI